jgi:hypothetical protein
MIPRPSPAASRLQDFFPEGFSLMRLQMRASNSAGSNCKSSLLQ